MGRRGLRARALAALLALLCAAAPATPQGRGEGTPAASGPFSADAYRVGERLTYSVSFSNFPTAAHVELLVAGRGQFAGREGVELRAHVETIGVVSAALYAVNNDYVTFVDPSTGTPYRAQRIIREGARTENATRDLGATAGVFDFLSALYRLRALPLAPGATYLIAVQGGAAVYDAQVQVSGVETVKTNVGSTSAIVAQVRVRANKVADDYRVRVYFSNDQYHVPLLITVRHPAGEIRAELASAEVLSAPQTPPAGVAQVAPTPTQPGSALPPVVTPPAAAVRPPAARATPTPTPGGGAPLPEDLPFKPGEQLNFNFYLGNSPQPIGVASFRVGERASYFDRDGLQLSSAMQTTGAGASLFLVNDQISSYVDATSLLPFRTELSIQEGRRNASWIVSADQNGGNALFDDGTRVPIPFATHDIVSVFYALRSFDLKPPKRNAVSLLVNKRPRLLYVTALRNATLALGGQQIPAVEVALVTGDPDGDRFRLRLWVSTDRRRLPLRLTAQTPLGPVRADLAIIPTTLH